MPPDNQHKKLDLTSSRRLSESPRFLALEPSFWDADAPVIHVIVDVWVTLARRSVQKKK